MLADIIYQMRQYVTSVTKEVAGIQTHYDLLGWFNSSTIEIIDEYKYRIEKKKQVNYDGFIVAFQDDMVVGQAHNFGGEDIVDKVYEIAQELMKDKGYMMSENRTIKSPKGRVIKSWKHKSRIIIHSQCISSKEARLEETAIRRNFKEELIAHTTFDYSDNIWEDLEDLEK